MQTLVYIINIVLLNTYTYESKNSRDTWRLRGMQLRKFSLNRKLVFPRFPLHITSSTNKRDSA